MDPSQVNGEDAILTWFKSNTYNSQTNDHIDAVCDIILDDLVGASDILSEAARKGSIVHTRNFTLDGPEFLGDIDLVLGPPASEGGQQQIDARDPVIHEESISDVWFALNIESMISSIKKNWKNRGRDIHSFYTSVYDAHPTAITGSIMLFNKSDLESSNPTAIIDAYRQFDFAEGSLAQELDSLAVIPLKNATGQATRAQNLILRDDDLNYHKAIKALATGLEKRVQGDFDIDEATVEALLSHDESNRLEFKRTVADESQDIAREAVALGNSEGGRILYGVDDNGIPIGLGEIDTAEERVSRILRDSITPKIVDNITRHTIDGRKILEVKIKQMRDVPASYNGIFYTRTGTTTSKLTGEEIVNLFPRP